jgi:hypothetical protein
MMFQRRREAKCNCKDRRKEVEEGHIYTVKARTWDSRIEVQALLALLTTLKNVKVEYIITILLPVSKCSFPMNMFVEASENPKAMGSCCANF